jgi:hypothetical protein
MRALGLLLLCGAACAASAEYRPTPRPAVSSAEYRPTPRPVPLPRRHGCPALVEAAKGLCPDELDLVPCDAPELQPGDFCEGDGECGTDKALNNCRNEYVDGADIYIVIGFNDDDPAVDNDSGSYRPTPRPVPLPLTCPAELRALPIETCNDMRWLSSPVSCDDATLRVGQYCDGRDGACGTDRNLNNCETLNGLSLSLYEVIATEIRRGGCPALGVAAKESCPGELDLVRCDAPELQPGDFCEGDGECGTDKMLNNCDDEEYKGADIYVVLDCDDCDDDENFRNPTLDDDPGTSICDDSCEWALDGVCDDGTAAWDPTTSSTHDAGYDDDMDDIYGAYYGDAYDPSDDDNYAPPCALGTDCTDCRDGPRCDNTCFRALDGVCDDARTKGPCALGTDCWDCGPIGNAPESGPIGNAPEAPPPKPSPPKWWDDDDWWEDDDDDATRSRDDDWWDDDGSRRAARASTRAEEDCFVLTLLVVARLNARP